MRDDGDNGTAHGGRHRRLFTGVGAVLVVLLVGGVWAAAAAFESPAQRAARALPPSPGPLLAEVRSGTLERTVSTAATIALEHEQAVPIATASAVGGAGAAAADVVTATIAPGSAISAGIRVVEVNGRPRLATTGTFRYYRDLSPGMSGPDVRQLQTFLGLDPDGIFGNALEKAVRGMYKQAGYAPMSVEAPAVEQGAPSSSTPAARPPTAQPPILVVPAAELLVFDTFPSYVASAPPVGDLPQDARLTVESGGFVARADVPLSFAHQMKDGLPVSVAYQDETIAGAVQGVGDGPSPVAATGTPGDPAGVQRSSDQKRVSYALAADAPVDFSWQGREVVVTAVVSSVATDSLIVPSIAVVTDRGGAAHVRKRTADGSFVEIAVTETATLDGKSAIRTLKAGALVAGDQVRTG